MTSSRLIEKTHMNRGLLVFIMFLLMTGVSFAQQGGPGGYGSATPEERATRLTGMMKDQLKLTAAQEPKVSAINLKYAKKNQEVRAIADTAQRRKTAIANETARDAELKAVFTASQYKEYIKLRDEMKARRRH
jgi:hypothetical protein